MTSSDVIVQLQRQLDETQRLLQAFQKLHNGGFDKESAARSDSSTYTLPSPSMLSNKIRLDVGGRVFATSKTTLLAQKNSFFDGMFGGRFTTQPDADGTYFIDRDPTMFGHILNFMRGQTLKLSKLNEEELQTLKEDAEFYQLPDLIDSLSLLAPPKFHCQFLSPGVNVSLNANRTRATKNWIGGWNGIVKGGELPKRGISRWNILLATTFLSNIYIGVSPYTSLAQTVNEKDADDDDDDTELFVDSFQPQGFYFSAFDSTLTAGPPFWFQSHKVGEYGTLEPISQGQVVGVEVSMDARTVEFFVDGKSLGVAYQNVPLGAGLCPCVVLYHEGDSVEIMAV
jgi:hypothetical protein